MTTATVSKISPADLAHMERIDDDILNRVLAYQDRFDFADFTPADVENALHVSNLTPEQYAALLSPAAMDYLEPMAQKALRLTRAQFGNTAALYTPLYIANYCVNECVYCGFNCKNKIQRGKLTPGEIEAEYETIAQTGLQEILILTGESRKQSPLEYIGEAVELAKSYFRTIGIEIYPLNTDEYAYLQQKGADFVSVYQETYNPQKYQEVHLRGPKCDFSYRFHSQERALLGGMRGVGIGALLGLDDFRQDAFLAGLHAKFLQQKYPHAEISFSVPRLRPYINRAENNPRDVHEPQLLQVMLAYRLLLPFAGITVSTRECARVRDNLACIAATKISAGVSTGVGSHAAEMEDQGDEQFEISDSRTVEEVYRDLENLGQQPVMNDYVYV